MSTRLLSRRNMLGLSLGGIAMGAGIAWRLPSAQAQAVQPVTEGGIAWYNVIGWGVEGRGWNDTQRYFDRLPAKAEAMVRPAVWNLSRHSAGMCVRFVTDATAIHGRYSLLSASLAMPHMPATGVSGLDFYAQDEQGRWRWVAVTRPDKQQISVQVVSGIRPGRRTFLVYLPLYNGTESLEIGVPEGSLFEPVPPRTTGLIVYYGTSIAHGACASRPGMAFPAILGRRFDRPVVNLGFSGNGRMEPELALLMAELDAAVYCIDCLPNMQAADVTARTEPFVHSLRQRKPEVPIVLVEDRTYTDAWILPERRQRNDTSRQAFRAAYERLVADGVKGLYYVEGEHLLGDDGDGSTDGSHPSDLGMMRMADALDPVLRPLLRKD